MRDYYGIRAADLAVLGGRSTSSLGGMKIAFVMSLLLAVGLANAATCNSLNHRIELRGVLTSETFPGPPNYTSISEGDRPETYFFITLRSPLCVPSGTSELEPWIDQVRTIQLIFNFATARSPYDALRPRLNKTVKCSGLLWPAETGHHHSIVVLTEAKCHPT